MRRVIVLAEAALDLETTRDFYNSIEPGVGDYCVTSLLADLGSLAAHLNPSPTFRSLPNVGRRFPFGIYYLETDTETRVIAILDLRRRPSWIRKELRQRKG